jgi:hypothetical protein
MCPFRVDDTVEQVWKWGYFSQMKSKQIKNIAPKKLKKLNSVALVRERTIPTERPPPVGEVSANFCG